MHNGRVNGTTTSHRYEVSLLAVWDHKVLPVIRHKWIHPP